VSKKALHTRISNITKKYKEKAIKNTAEGFTKNTRIPRLLTGLLIFCGVILRDMAIQRSASLHSLTSSVPCHALQVWLNLSQITANDYPD
jgi:hypothetical protein